MVLIVINSPGITTTPHAYFPKLKKKKTYMNSCLFPRMRLLFEVGSTLKGKSLLLRDQTLSFKG